MEKVSNVNLRRVGSEPEEKPGREAKQWFRGEASGEGKNLGWVDYGERTTMMIIIMKIEVPQQIGNFFNKDASIERDSMICFDRST